MNAQPNLHRSYVQLGLAYVAVCGFLVAIGGMSSSVESNAQALGAEAEASELSISVSAEMIARPDARRSSNPPMSSPVAVDYRHKGPAENCGSRMRVVGTTDFTVWEPHGSTLKAASGDPCLIDRQCYTCNVCVEYACTDFTCEETILDGVTGVTGCDDGLYCNGAERCVDGVCVAGTAPDCGAQVCDEGQDACADPCGSAGDCDDGRACTDDACVAQVCVHTNVCGPGARCFEPDPPDTNPVCIAGRCCAPGDPVTGCTRETYDACADAWLPIGSDTNTCEDDQMPCPAYSAGIAVDSVITEIGPISNTDCDSYVTIGDDYETWDHASLDPINQYMDVYFMRFLARVEPGSLDGARWSIEFRTDTGDLIENTFCSDGINDDGGFGIRQMNFDPPITIPTKGIVSFTVQANFGLDGRVNVYGTTATENGSNNAGSMYVENAAKQGAIVNDLLGTCSGGTRAGLSCDRRNGNDDCLGGGSCADAPDILAFEMLATPGTKPSGACCNPGTGVCTQELPWDCAGAFQGVGTLCGLCTDGVTPCGNNADCDPPDPGSCLPIEACVTQACCSSTTGNCIATTNTTCTGTVCDNEPTIIGCTLDEECPIGGTCVTVTGTSQGFGTDCDPNCCLQPEGSYIGADNCLLAETGMPVIVVPPLGDAPPIVATITGDNSGATYDDSNLVCQSGPNEGNTCATNEDCGQCVGGTNTGEPCDEDTDCPDPFVGACEVHACDEICAALFLDADGDTRDPGWWTAFRLQSVDDCADVRVDLCCSDVNGDAVRPQWANLFSECPCGTVITQEGVDGPIGIGRDTEGFAYGPPFCSGDNLWETYRLRDGVYYKAIYSAPSGTSAVPPGSDFQVHITAKACPIAVCCLGGECSVVNELDCAELGGYWLYGNVDCGFDADCALPAGESDNPCCTGSCCVDIVDCVDQLPSGQPMTKEDCDIIIEGEYVGGATCEADPFPCPPGGLDLIEYYRYTVEVEDYPSVEIVASYDADARLLQAEIQSPLGSSVEAVGLSDLGGGFLTGEITVSISGPKPGQGINLTSNFLFSPFDGPAHTEQISADADLPISGGRDDGTVTVKVDGKTTEDPATGQKTTQVEVSADVKVADKVEVGVKETVTQKEDEGTSTKTEESIKVKSDNDGVETSVTVTATQVKDADGRKTQTTQLDGKLGNEQAQVTVGAKRIETEQGTTKTLSGSGSMSLTGTGLGNGVDIHGRLQQTDDPLTGRRSSWGAGLRYRRELGKGWSFEGGYDFHRDFGAGRESHSGFFSFTFRFRSDILDASAENLFCCPTPEECVDDSPLPESTILDDEVDCFDLTATVETSNIECISLPPTLTLEALPVPCCTQIPPPPAHDSSPVPVDTGAGMKNRYLTFCGGESGEMLAARVTFLAVPGYEYAEGRTMWVQEPVPVTESSGSNGPVPPPTFWAAELGCDPYYTDWTLYDRVDVYDDAIVPDGMYDVQFIHFDCVPIAEEYFSDRLTVRMSRSGDIVGNNVTPPPPSAPQGVVDFVDISSCVDKFKNAPRAPRKARADIVNSDISSPIPDQKVDFVDISCVVEAFRGRPCTPPGPPVDPCGR